MFGDGNHGNVLFGIPAGHSFDLRVELLIFDGLLKVRERSAHCLCARGHDGFRFGVIQSVGVYESVTGGVAATPLARTLLRLLRVMFFSRVWFTVGRYLIVMTTSVRFHMAPEPDVHRGLGLNDPFLCVAHLLLLMFPTSFQDTKPDQFVQLLLHLAGNYTHLR